MIQQILDEFEKEFLPKDIKPKHAENKEYADIMLDVLKHTYRSWLEQKLTELVESVPCEFFVDNQTAESISKGIHKWKDKQLGKEK